jgi:hypothetical protein
LRRVSKTDRIWQAEFVRAPPIRLRNVKYLRQGTRTASLLRPEMNFDRLNEWRSSHESFLSHEVLNYLLQHPEAQDTIEGIAEWWLLQQRICNVVGNLELAIEDMVKKGFLLASEREDGRLCYRLNRDREREIRGHLRKSESRLKQDDEKRRPDNKFNARTCEHLE